MCVRVFHCLCAAIARWARNFYFMSANEFVFDVAAALCAYSKPFCFTTQNAKYPHNFNVYMWYVAYSTKIARGAGTTARFLHGIQRSVAVCCHSMKSERISYCSKWEICIKIHFQNGVAITILIIFIRNSISTKSSWLNVRFFIVLFFMFFFVYSALICLIISCILFS